MSLKIAVAAYLCGLLSYCRMETPFNPGLDRLWQDYKVTHEKMYNGLEEYGRRLIWEKNVRKINQHNLEANMGKHTYWMGINRFTDWTVEEWDQVRRSRIIPGSHSHSFHETAKTSRTNVSYPDSVDWRDKGYVTDVKDQGNCSSGWAFAVAGSIEGQLKASSGKLVPLSMQELVDCGYIVDLTGCKGGEISYWMAYNYVQWCDGIATEESYPYTGKQSNCTMYLATVGATIMGSENITDEGQLRFIIIKNGPVSVGIDVTDKFMHYKSGIFYDPDCSSKASDLKHGVLVVGYGVEGDSEYWIVKNSWGKLWGQEGYILMSKNRDNNCGIATSGAYPWGVDPPKVTTRTHLRRQIHYSPATQSGT